MQLTREHPGDRIYVRAANDDGITIAEQTYSTSLILSADSVDPNWPVEAFADLDEKTLKPLLELEPELVIIGTGSTQKFPGPELLMMFHRAGVGIEVMTTRAACRTFNILVMEERKVVAALIQPATE